MKIFGISDLHLSFTTDKAMDKFGAKWSEHWKKIESNWRGTISDDDVVLIPGDISWGMRPMDAVQDIKWLCSLPGKKVLTRGNHDYWWQSISKMRNAYPDLIFLQNDSITFGDTAICGTRGWTLPGASDFKEEDRKLYLRELARLEMALKTMPNASCKIAMLHFPPAYAPYFSSGFTDLLEQYGINICVYGHLHGQAVPSSDFDFQAKGIDYKLISCDYLNFKPLLIRET